MCVRERKMEGTNFVCYQQLQKNMAQNACWKEGVIGRFGSSSTTTENQNEQVSPLCKCSLISLYLLPSLSAPLPSRLFLSAIYLMIVGVSHWLIILHAASLVHHCSQLLCKLKESAESTKIEMMKLEQFFVTVTTHEQQKKSTHTILTTNLPLVGGESVPFIQ